MKHFTVEGRDAGKRLDVCLVDKLGLSRNNVKELIDLGRVRVNGQRVVIAKWELAAGDNVEAMADGLEHGARNRDISKEFVKVVYEDRDILVVEKPSGVVIQAAGSGGPTFVDSLREYLKRKHKSRGAYVKPVHRLDKETSGLMVFAKSKVGEKLIEEFSKHAVERSYFAVVEGAVGDENGKIDLPIEKGDFGHGRKAGVGRGSGQKALTLYEVKERYEDATFMELDLKTGRTHQARVHLAAVGHPIVGDAIYGRGGGIKFGRQALHSCKLSFRHPATGKWMKFASELPADMEKLIDELRGN